MNDQQFLHAVASVKKMFISGNFDESKKLINWNSQKDGVCMAVFSRNPCTDFTL